MVYVEFFAGDWMRLDGIDRSFLRRSIFTDFPWSVCCPTSLGLELRDQLGASGLHSRIRWTDSIDPGVNGFGATEPIDVLCVFDERSGGIVPGGFHQIAQVYERVEPVW